MLKKSLVNKAEAFIYAKGTMWSYEDGSVFIKHTRALVAHHHPFTLMFVHVKSSLKQKA